jgi:hypothetical protein
MDHQEAGRRTRAVGCRRRGISRTSVSLWFKFSPPALTCVLIFMVGPPVSRFPGRSACHTAVEVTGKYRTIFRNSGGPFVPEHYDRPCRSPFGSSHNASADRRSAEIVSSHSPAYPRVAVRTRCRLTPRNPSSRRWPTPTPCQGRRWPRRSDLRTPWLALYSSTRRSLLPSCRPPRPALWCQVSAAVGGDEPNSAVAAPRPAPHRTPIASGCL